MNTVTMLKNIYLFASGCKWQLGRCDENWRWGLWQRWALWNAVTVLNTFCSTAQCITHNACTISDLPAHPIIDAIKMNRDDIRKIIQYLSHLLDRDGLTDEMEMITSSMTRTEKQKPMGKHVGQKRKPKNRNTSRSQR